jgi:hypothetical protein
VKESLAVIDGKNVGKFTGCILIILQQRKRFSIWGMILFLPAKATVTIFLPPLPDIQTGVQLIVK